MSIFKRVTNLLRGVSPASRVIFQTPAIGESMQTIDSSRPLATWRENQDVFKGLEFFATLQLRTPLRVLLRHGEQHRDVNSEPPEIVREMWEGIWVPKTKTFRDLGLDIDEFPTGTAASDAGQISPEAYLPFLVTVRQIVESDESIQRRITRLRQVPMEGVWKIGIDRHGGIDSIIDYFFTPFVRTIPKIGDAQSASLTDRGVTTPNAIAAASDDLLLSIKGLGPAKLDAIRSYCAGVTQHRDADRVDNVTR